MASKDNQKGFGAIEVLLLIIALVLIFGVGYYVYNTRSDKDTKMTTTKQEASSADREASNKPVDSESELIESAVKESCESVQGHSAEQVSVTKHEGNYAAATASCLNPDDVTAGVTRYYLQKTSGKWSVVHKGSGAPTTSEDLAPYGFPADFIE